MTLSQRAQTTYEIEQSAVQVINLNTLLRHSITGQDGSDVLIPAHVISHVLKEHARIAKELTEHAMRELNGGNNDQL